MNVKDMYGKYIGHTAYKCNECGHEFIVDENSDVEVDLCPECDSDDLTDLVEEDLARVCSHCGKIMNEGYLINGGDAYYCSDECLDKHISPEEKAEMLDDDDCDGDSYWTEWEG